MKKGILDQEAEIYASLSHPRRLEILHLLARSALPVGEISAMVGIPQATVSQHLMVLRRLLLVKVYQRAQSRVYSLSSPIVAKLLTSTRSLLVASHILPEIFIDPVCGMEVTKQSAAAEFLHNAKTYYFCANGCKKVFEKNPARFGRTKDTHEKGVAL